MDFLSTPIKPRRIEVRKKRYDKVLVFIAVNYLQQLRKTESRAIAALQSDMLAIVRARAGTSIRDEEPFLFSFDESYAACNLQAIESALECKRRLEGEAGILHGWSIYLAPSGSGESEDFARCRSAWRKFERESAVFIEESLANRLARYVRLERSGVTPIATERAYAHALGGRPGHLSLHPVAAKLEAALAKQFEAFLPSGDNAIAIFGPEGSGKKEACAAALSSKAEPLTVKGTYGDENPFAPLLSAISPSLVAKGDTLFTSEERSFWKSLVPAYEIVRAEGFRKAFPSHVMTGFKLFFAAILELWRRDCSSNGRQPVVLCTDVHLYPEASIDLLGAMLDLKSGSPGCKFVATCTGRLPRGLEGRIGAKLETREAERSEILDWFDASEVPAPPRIPLRADALECGWNLELAMRRASGENRRGDAGSEPYEWLPRDEACEKILAALPPEAETFLHSAALAGRSLKAVHFERFMERLGFTPALFAMVRDMLATRGLCDSRAPFVPLTPALAAVAEKALGSEAESLRRTFIRFVASLFATREIPASLGVWERARTDLTEDRFPLLLDAISSELAIGFPESIAEYVSSRRFESLDEERCFQVGAFDASMEANDRDACVKALDSLKGAKGTSTRFPSGIASLCQAAFAYAAGDPSSCQSYAKTAVMELHGKNNFRGEARSLKLLGLASLASGRIFDAMDYFANGFDVAKGAREDFDAMHCAFSGAIAHFIYGNVSRAIRWFDSASAEAVRLHRKDWEGLSTFARGRARFECGQYAAAKEEFARLERQCSLFRDDGLERLSILWSARADVYAGRPELARDALESRPEDAEALFFRAEERYLAGDHQAALALAEASLARVGYIRFYSPDTPHVDSGFRCFEQRGVGTLSGQAFEADVIRAFASFVESFVDSDRDYAREIHNMTREERIANVHPYYHQYCFYSYLIVDSGAESSLDKLTALSKAFKALQQRACRNDETSLKNSYLEANLWNRRIVEAAKEHKFV
jgi:tetratricopeptide (TPR) repeat protein